MFYQNVVSRHSCQSVIVNIFRALSAKKKELNDRPTYRHDGSIIFSYLLEGGEGIVDLCCCPDIFIGLFFSNYDNNYKGDLKLSER